MFGNYFYELFKKLILYIYLHAVIGIIIKPQIWLKFFLNV